MPQVAYGGMSPGEPGLLEGFVSWLGDDYRMCDPLELDAKLRDDAAMLLPEEAVQMGFVCGRDAVVFTTHRAIQIDTQWLGSKVLYLSLPWTAIKTYKVQSAGTWDLDAEMKLGIYAPWYNQEVGPGLTIDFSRGRCDILAVNTFLSCQTIGAADGTSTIAREVLPPCPEGPIGELFSWLGDDFHQIPAAAATGQFKSARRSCSPTRPSSSRSSAAATSTWRRRSGGSRSTRSARTAARCPSRACRSRRCRATR